jgi:hypothetical protein
MSTHAFTVVLTSAALALLGGCSSGGTTSGGAPFEDASTSTSDDSGAAADATDTTDAAAPSSDASSGGPSTPTKTPTEALCDRIVDECNNTYYKDAADCVKQSLDYWGSCKARIDALDAYSECIGKLPCSTIGGSYNPSSTPCASLYSDLKATKCN